MVYYVGGHIGYITTYDEHRHATYETRKFKYFERGKFMVDTYPRRSKRKSDLGTKKKNT